MKNIILGAGGHAKEVIDILIRDDSEQVINLFNNVAQKNYKLFDKFNVYCNNEDLCGFDTFYLGVGNIHVRKILSNLAFKQGLNWQGVRSNTVSLGTFDINIDNTVDIMDNVFISSDIKIGRGTLLNRGVNIHHDVVIGNFCEIAPNAQILGNALIGDDVFIGAGAIILPNIVIGNGSVVGAGAVVTKNTDQFQTVKGIPAR